MDFSEYVDLVDEVYDIKTHPIAECYANIDHIKYDILFFESLNAACEVGDGSKITMPEAKDIKSFDGMKEKDEKCMKLMEVFVCKRFG